MLAVHRRQNSVPFYLSTTFPLLDRVLHGGIAAGSITEVGYLWNAFLIN
jgi:RecA/RadA recombinase